MKLILGISAIIVGGLVGLLTDQWLGGLVMVVYGLDLLHWWARQRAEGSEG